MNKKILIFFLVTCISHTIYATPFQKPTQDSIIQFIFCSDVHFGITRKEFRGQQDVPSRKVNDAMIKAMNGLTRLQLPVDNGANAGNRIKNIQALVLTGDIANREENGVQSAKKSWKEFKKEYLKKLNLHNENGHSPILMITTGNHDVSDAIGFHRPMKPLNDPSSLIGIYNLMMNPEIPLTKSAFHYEKDIIHFSRDIGSIHFVFINLWPDSSERAWMEKDLSNVPDSIPVFIFTHSMPDVEARFFVNPNNDHSINPNDKFENLLTEMFKDGTNVKTPAIIEQKALADFLKQHPNIKGYFHGHNNYTQFYEWKGPDNNILLHCYRVDSPMKGEKSSKDETKISFQLVSINLNSKTITSRECLWNSEPTNPAHPIVWGASVTNSLR